MRSSSRYLASLSAAGLLAIGVSGTAAAAGPPRHVFHGQPSVLSAAQVRRLSADATHHSIIIFRNQLASLPARGVTAGPRIRAASAAQAGVRSELARLHAGDVRSFQIINAISATISAAEIARLQADPAIAAVVPDAVRQFAPLGGGPGPAIPAAVAAARQARASSPAARQQICPASPSQPLIEPEARTVLNVPAAQQIVTGTGIRVGIIADGIDPDNPDLIRANGQHVIFDYGISAGSAPARRPTAGRRSWTPARSPRRATRPMTCPAS